jgi:mono/diheme cytochrome c family protein
MHPFHAALIAAGILTPIALGGQTKPIPDITSGKAVYANKCKICHGADGEGKTGYAKAMDLEPTQLGSDEVQRKTDVELKKIITEGTTDGKMKPIKTLSDVDIGNLIAYVRATFGKK